jgi:hypothetical protein
MPVPFWDAILNAPGRQVGLEMAEGAAIPALLGGGAFGGLWFGREKAGRAALKAGRVLGRGAEATARGAGRLAAGGLGAAARHPKTTIATAAILGAGASLAHAAFSPDVQNTVFHDPDFLPHEGNFPGHLIGGELAAQVINNYRPSDIDNPYAAQLHMGSGTIYQTPDYEYGRPINGQALGAIAGSRTFGGWNIQSRQRIRGKGIDVGADGRIVFGMWNARR